MSSDIEFRHVAFRVDVGAGIEAMRRLAPRDQAHAYGYSEHCNPAHLVFVEAGCSNVIADDGKVSRRWYLLFVGDNVIDQAIHTSVGAEGGMIKPFGRTISAEGYISLYRRVLREALPIEKLLERIGPLKLRLDADLFRAPGEGNPYRNQAQARESHDFTAYLVDRPQRLAKETTMEYGQMSTRWNLVLPDDPACDETLAMLAWLIRVGYGEGHGNRVTHLADGRSYSLSSSLDFLLAEARFTRKFPRAA